MNIFVPKRYVPTSLNRSDKKQQKSELRKSRKLYKKGIYHTRKKVDSFKNKKSNHILNTRNIYRINKVKINKSLSKKTGCSMTGLQKIQKKGEGAYFSSGSRPNQTGTSWGVARLASSITGGKASMVDYSILEKYCKKNSKALKLANKTMRKYKPIKKGVSNKKIKKTSHNNAYTRIGKRRVKKIRI